MWNNASTATTASPMAPASQLRLPDPHDFDRLIVAGRALAALDLHRKPMRAEVYRTTAVAIATLLLRVRDTQALRDVVAMAEPSQTVYENVAFERDGDFRAAVGAAPARAAAAAARALLGRAARPGALR
jgi:hypothetical protein